MSCDVPFLGIEAGQSRPLIPSVKHHGGKGTEQKGHTQTVCRFFFDLLSFLACKEPIHRGKAGWGIAGLLLDNNYRQLTNNYFSTLSFTDGSEEPCLN